MVQQRRSLHRLALCALAITVTLAVLARPASLLTFALIAVAAGLAGDRRSMG